MIEMLVQIHNKDQITKFKEKSCNYFCVTTPFLSSSLEHTSSIHEIIDIEKSLKPNESKIGLIINRLIMENEFNEFEIELNSVLSVVSFDFYVVSDVGVLLYLQSTSNAPVFLHSDTTIANVYDASVMLKNGASKIMPARELTLNKKLEITNQLNDQIMLPVFGYQIMSKSYRPLLTNYFHEIDVENQSKFKKHFFKEEKRDQLFIGFEDDHGFSMFSDHVVHLIEEKEQLEQNNCKFGWIDSNFIEDGIISEVIAYFHDKISKQQMLSVLKLHSKNHVFSKGLNYKDTALSKDKTS